MEPCNRGKEGICAEKGKGVSIVKGRKRGGERVYLRTTEKGVYLTVKVTPDGASILCGKKDGKKRMVQDYRYLNKWTIKNNYPSP